MNGFQITQSAAEVSIANQRGDFAGLLDTGPDLRQCHMRVLEMDFLRTPAAGDLIEHYIDNLRSGAANRRNTPVGTGIRS